MVGEKNDLGASRSKILNDCGPDTRCAPLRMINVAQLRQNVRHTVTMITLECIKRSEILLAPPKYHFASHVRMTQGNAFSIGRRYGIESGPLKTMSPSNGIGILTTLVRGNGHKITWPSS